MEATKQKRTFKETVKDTGSKAKAYAKKQGEKHRFSRHGYPLVTISADSRRGQLGV